MNNNNSSAAANMGIHDNKGGRNKLGSRLRI